MADVFVSYSRRDRERVAPLVAAIEASGWSVWWDPAIFPGQEFDRRIDAELRAAAAVLVVWTRDSVESRWVRGEAREALDRDILVPVRFGQVSLPFDVRAIHTIDFDEAATDAGNPNVRDMLRALERLVARRKPSVDVMAESEPQPVASGPSRVSICVLPFTNMSGESGQEFFSDGFTEDIITELSRWRFLAVRSRSASFHFRGADVDVKQVTRELNVQFIVEGSVRRVGERIRITAQLIDAGTGDHVWADKFDRESTSVFSVQDQVVRTIVSTLVGRVQVSNIEQARRKPPASLAAYEYVLKGNALPWEDPEGAKEAKRLFEKAIELDPGYGLAHALVSAILCGQWRDDPGDASAILDEAYAQAKRAVELDENESTCFSMLSQICLVRRSFDLALQYMQRAVEINPNNQWNMADMGIVLNYTGQPEQALVWLKRARETDPYFDQPWYWRTMALSLMSLQRYDEALAMLDHVTIDHYRNAALKAACLARLGNLDRARAALAECMAMNPGCTIRHFMAKEPFKRPTDAARMAESLRLAGLPA